MRGAAALVATILVPLALTGAATPAGGGGALPASWLTFGNGPARTSAAGAAVTGKPVALWTAKLGGAVTAQPLVVRDVPARRRHLVVTATAAGTVTAWRDDGRLRWRKRLGHLLHGCPQLPEYGVTGTPVVDPAAGTVYAADAQGLLHALDVRSGRERAGWPVRLLSDPRTELVWGALTLAAGRVYAATGSYCDGPMEAHVVAVSTTTREVVGWTPVPVRLGGGGGIWGWGGMAFGGARRSLYAATGNAFRGGENDGPAFREDAGYGENLVELTPELSVRASSHPPGIAQPLDLDFGGAPLLLQRPGCGELVVAPNKDGRVYAWRSGEIAAGPAWSLAVQALRIESPLIGQPAWSAPLRSLYVATGSQLVRIAVDADCRPQVRWKDYYRTEYLNGSPTVAGATVWLSLATFGGDGGRPGVLLAIDARTGRIQHKLRLDGVALAAPVVVGRRLYVASFAGRLSAFRLG